MAVRNVSSAGPATAFRFSQVAAGPPGPQGPPGAPGAGITFGSDLAGSGTSNQWVGSISGAGGASPVATVGNGLAAFTLRGYHGAYALTLIGGKGDDPGNTGGNLIVSGGAGGNQSVSGFQGGPGGNLNLNGGPGGTQFGVANNINGGDVVLATGLPGTGGSGTPGFFGNMYFRGDDGAGNPLTQAFIANGALGGFGIGANVATDPTITRGTGVPTAAMPNGSVFLRTNGTSTTGIYTRQSGVWSAVGSSALTFAKDLNGSSLTNQYVVGISGSGGAGGTITMGDGSHALNFTAVASVGATPPLVSFLGSNGFSFAGTGTGGGLSLTPGTGATPSSAGNGAAGGALTLTGGTGANANGGGNLTGAGGNVVLNGGVAGSIGLSPITGNVLLQSGGTTYAFVYGGTTASGFGIGTTPGTDPLITRGTGVPSATVPNGSIFIRTDGSSGSNGVYTSQAGTWYPLGSAGVLTAFGADLANSAGTLQYVSGISFDSTGAAGAGGSVSVKGTSTVLNWLNKAVTLNYTGTTVLSAGLNSADFLLLGSSTATLKVKPTGLLFGITQFASISQSIPVTDIAPNAMSITAQSAEAAAVTNLTGATLNLVSGAGATTNGTPGNVAVSMPAPSGTGTAGLFTVTGGTSGSAVLMSLGQASSDMIIVGAGTATAKLTPTGTLFGSTAAPNISQTLPVADVVPNSFTITAQGAQAAASTNVTGANIALTPGAPATTNGSVGNVQVLLPAHTGTGQNGYFQVKQGTSAPVIQMGGFGNTANPTAGGIWMNPSHPPNAGWSPTFYNDTTDTLVTRAASMNTLISGNACMSATNANIQFFSQTNIGTGLNVIGITNVITVPTATPTSGLLLWSNTGSPGSLGLMATGVAFHRLAGAIAIAQDTATTDVVTTAMSITAQTAYASAVTNTGGAGLTLAGGNATSGTAGASIILGGGAGAVGTMQVTSSAIGGNAAGSGTPWAWTSTTIALTTGTVTLTAAQIATPLIVLTGTLSGAVTIVLPNAPGFWMFNAAALIAASANTFRFQSGSANSVALNTLGTSTQIVMVVTGGSNSVAINT